jgi:hypothetical protein
MMNEPMEAPGGHAQEHGEHHHGVVVVLHLTGSIGANSH